MAKFSIITSDSNIASVNIRERLVEMFPFREDGGRHVLGGGQVAIESFGENMLFMDRVDSRVDSDVLIFASTHTSRAGVDALTVHAVGNWGSADLGGKEKSLCPVPAALLKDAFSRLHKTSLGVEAIQEATHHGPFVGKPAMFIEIGSSGRMYSDIAAGRFIAQVIMGCISTAQPKISAAVGIGGLHHCPNFAKVMLESDIAVGHVCPKHMLRFFDAEMLKMAMQRTVPEARLAVVDWKGLGEHKMKVRRLLADAGVDWVKTSDF